MESRTWSTRRDNGWNQTPRDTDASVKDDISSPKPAVLMRHSVGNALYNGYGSALRAGECCRYWQHCLESFSDAPGSKSALLYASDMGEIPMAKLSKMSIA